LLGPKKTNNTFANNTFGPKRRGSGQGKQFLAACMTADNSAKVSTERTEPTIATGLAAVAARAAATREAGEVEWH